MFRARSAAVTMIMEDAKALSAMVTFGRGHILQFQLRTVDRGTS